MKPDKPLGQKAYGSIAHLPNSRKGPADRSIHEGQARICCEKARDKHDIIHVQEKVDGGCVSVARIDGGMVPLGRAGYPALTSPFEQHHHFHEWAWMNRERFLSLLEEGERVVGEWMMQAHGTRYDLPHEPFVPFDIMRGHKRATLEEVERRCWDQGFTIPYVLHSAGPLSVEDALTLVEPSHHGALEPVEGCVWRVERKGVVDFLAKYVRPDKVDGCYLPEQTGGDPVWNWRP